MNLNRHIGSFRRVFAAFCACSIFYPTIASAELDWQGNGFGTFGGGVLNDDSINTQGAFRHNSFEESFAFDIDTRLGYQASLSLNDKFSITAQLVVRAIDDFEPNLEWGYLTFHSDHGFLVNVGRQRRPSYAYSDYLDVGYAYPWIRPPLEVYSRDLSFFSEVDAISVHYQRPFDEWTGSVQVYYGGTTDNAAEIAGDRTETNTRDDAGLFLGLENDHINLRLGYQVLPNVDLGDVEFTNILIRFLDNAGYSDIAQDLVPSSLYIEYYNFAIGVDKGDWLFNAEYTQTDYSRSLAADELSWYAMGGRRLGPFTLHYTYADRERVNNEKFTGPIRADAESGPGSAALQGVAALVETALVLSSLEQHSHTLGIRYDFDKAYSLKVEYQWVYDDRDNLSNQLFSFAIDFVF